MISEQRPPGWTKLQADTLSSELRRCANYSTTAWRVGREDHRLVVSILPDTGVDPGSLTSKVGRDKAVGRMTSFVAKGGRLVGRDAGEFGGELRWEETDTGKSKTLLTENVVAIIPIRDGAAMLLTGIDHLSIYEGKAYRWTETQPNNGWKPRS